LRQKGGSRVWQPWINRVKLMAKLTEKKGGGRGRGKLGSGKPYDECSEMEAALVIPDVS